jgi:hypothetical protein
MIKFDLDSGCPRNRWHKPIQPAISRSLGTQAVPQKADYLLFQTPHLFTRHEDKATKLAGNRWRLRHGRLGQERLLNGRLLNGRLLNIAWAWCPSQEIPGHRLDLGWSTQQEPILIAIDHERNTGS